MFRKSYFFLILYLSLIFIDTSCSTDLEVNQKKKKYKYEVAVVAIFQNDAPYIKEWIEFHRLLGVQKFLLFNNLSQDNYLEVLNPYISKGIVELIDWNYKQTNIVDWNSIQCAAYMHGIQHFAGKARWVAFLDTDEFLFPIKEKSLVRLLSEFDGYAGVCFNWQIYGTSNVMLQPGELLIEKLRMKLTTNDTLNTHVKSVVNPEKVENCTNPHFFAYKPGYFQVNTNKEAFIGCYSPSILLDKGRINHYSYRDVYFFENVKIPRNIGWGMTEETIREREHEANNTKDTSIYQFVKPLKAKMDFL